MTKRWWLSGVALVAGAALLTAVACTAAPDKDDPKKAGDEPAAKDNKEGDSVNNVLLAYKLAEYGRGKDHPSPLALITAAEILSGFKVADPNAKDAREGLKDYKAEPGEGSTVVKADPQGFFKEEAGKLLDEAAKMLDADQDHLPADITLMKNELARVRKAMKGEGTGSRAPAAGPLVYRMKVKPGQTDTYNVKFNQNEWARIAVHSEGGPDSRLYVAAVNPRGVKRADDGGHDPSIAFIPHAKDDVDFKITVTNKGPAEVVYQLFIN